ncbi:MAG: deoxyribodipyrimidine photo-lyase [Armatimonadia bacterium]
MVQATRLRELNSLPVRKGRYVLYWMQASQRAECNHALEYAIREANRLQLPVLVVFGLTHDYPSANERHYRFMLEGLGETQQALAKRGMRLVALDADPPQAALHLSRDAALLVCDCGYTRVQTQWREQVAAEAQCPVVQVETDVVVPVEAASDKEEFAARTIRPKLHRLLPEYLVSLNQQRPHLPSLDLPLPGRLRELDLSDPAALLKRLKLPQLPVYGAASRFTGGTAAGRKALSEFLQNRLDHYDELQSDPSRDATSHVSPFLHFGQLSPLEVALAVQGHGGPGVEPFLEQLIVRRELAMNFVHYNPQYDQYASIPQWATVSLREHAADPRPVLYTLEQLEQAATADEYWNAAMQEMLLTGFMHNYMRMYWGKKVLEWSRTPQEAFERLVHLNDKYFVDGRDPASYMNIAWCFGKHDRPFAERPIFGKIRYMNAAGLKRKFNMKAYLERVTKYKR